MAVAAALLLAPGDEGIPPTSIAETDDALMEALRTLSDADQEVLMLRAWEGLSASEVAHAVGCSSSAAEKRLARAMRRLEAAVKSGVEGIGPSSDEFLSKIASPGVAGAFSDVQRHR